MIIANQIVYDSDRTRRGGLSLALRLFPIHETNVKLLLKINRRYALNISFGKI